MLLMSGVILGLVGCESALSASASQLDTEVVKNLNMTYGEEWEDLLEDCYGDNWKSKLESKYSASINDCVMMEVERLEKLDDIDDRIEDQLEQVYGVDWEDCLEQMYGDDWDDALEAKYGVDFDDYLEAELEAVLGRSGTLELDDLDDQNDDLDDQNDDLDDQDDDCDDTDDMMSRNCH